MDGLPKRAQALLFAGFVVLCVVALAIPCLFGERFGWMGRLWVLLVAITYWPLSLLWAYRRDRSDEPQ